MTEQKRRKRIRKKENCRGEIFVFIAYEEGLESVISKTNPIANGALYTTIRGWENPARRYRSHACAGHRLR